MDNKPSQIIKFITFKVADYWFSLPIAAVLKIVNCPPPEKGGIVTLGVVQLGSHTIQLLDLYSMFDLDADAKTLEKSSFLLVLRNAQKKLLGITLDTPPDLIELSLSNFQSVPKNNYSAAKRRWVSHIAVVSEQGISRTLLLLNLKALFTPEAA